MYIILLIWFLCNHSHLSVIRTNKILLTCVFLTYAGGIQAMCHNLPVQGTISYLCSISVTLGLPICGKAVKLYLYKPLKSAEWWSWRRIRSCEVDLPPGQNLRAGSQYFTCKSVETLSCDVHVPWQREKNEATEPRTVITVSLKQLSCHINNHLISSQSPCKWVLTLSGFSMGGTMRDAPRI